MRRCRAAACVGDHETAYVIGGAIGKQRNYEILGDTWRLKLRRADILCEAIETTVDHASRLGYVGVYFEGRIVVLGGEN